MKKFIFAKFLFLIISCSLNAQLFHKNILILKGNSRVHQDTSSQIYLEKYKDVPNLLVQIRDKYEYEDLGIFQKATNIKKLSIHSNSITSLSGLEHLQELESLSINKCFAQDFSALKSLKNIKELSIDSKVKINFPLNYNLLQKLKYSCNYDLQNCDFPNLEEIVIHQAVAIDYPYDDYENYGIEYSLEEPCCALDLSKLKSLSEIRIYNMQIQSLDEISFPKGIKKININNCTQLKNIDDIRNLKNLEELGISYCNNIENFQFLTELENVTWKLRYMGKVFRNEDLDILLNHPKNVYYYCNDTDEHDTEDFYNFHTSVVEQAKIIFKKYHQLILSNNLSRKEFLDMISPLIRELNNLCTEDTCHINWNDDESYYLMQFLNDMAQMKGYEFEESHFYARYDWE